MMERTQGNPDVMIGLVDGPVAMPHPELAGVWIREVAGQLLRVRRHGLGLA